MNSGRRPPSSQGFRPSSSQGRRPPAPPEPTKLTEWMLSEVLGEDIPLSRAASLRLVDRGLTELDAVGKCPKLRQLDVSFNPLESLKGIQSLKDLREIILCGVGLKSLANVFLSLKELRSVVLDSNKLVSFKNLGSLPKLESLSAVSNSLVTLADVAPYVTLNILDVTDNKLTNLEGLSKLSRLSELRAGYNDLSSVTGNMLPKSLLELELQHNRLASDFKWLRRLSSLKVLRLDGNALGPSALASFPPLPTLSELSAAKTGLADLAPLGRLCPALEILDVRHNSVSEWPAVDALAALEELFVLRMDGNPVVATPEGRASLIARLPNIETLDGLDLNRPSKEARERMILENAEKERMRRDAQGSINSNVDSAFEDNDNNLGNNRDDSTVAIGGRQTSKESKVFDLESGSDDRDSTPSDGVRSGLSRDSEEGGKRRVGGRESDRGGERGEGRHVRGSASEREKRERRGDDDDDDDDDDDGYGDAKDSLRATAESIGVPSIS
eukprot:Rmarinus@m.23904